MLAANAAAFAALGIYVPRMGRPAGASGETLSGHHNVAWQINGDPRFDPKYGTLAQLTDELAATTAPVAVVSSEDFALSHDRPGALEALREAIAAAGFEPYVVIYLRTQSSYAGALYAELTQHQGALDCSFDDFSAAVITDGAFRVAFYTLPFDYAALLRAFETPFGAGRILVRPYASGGPSDALLRDFIAVIAPDGVTPDLARLQAPGRLNERVRFSALMETLRLHYLAVRADLPNIYTLAQGLFGSVDETMLEGSFAPIGPAEAARYRARFAASNDALRERYGFAWPQEPEPELSETRTAHHRLMGHALAVWRAACVPTL
jgi:hypothetical protein